MGIFRQLEGEENGQIFPHPEHGLLAWSNIFFLIDEVSFFLNNRYRFKVCMRTLIYRYASSFLLDILLGEVRSGGVLSCFIFPFLEIARPAFTDEGGFFKEGLSMEDGILLFFLIGA